MSTAVMDVDHTLGTQAAGAATQREVCAFSFKLPCTLSSGETFRRYPVFRRYLFFLVPP